MILLRWHLTWKTPCVWVRWHWDWETKCRCESETRYNRLFVDCWPPSHNNDHDTMRHQVLALQLPIYHCHLPPDRNPCCYITSCLIHWQQHDACGRGFVWCQISFAPSKHFHEHKVKTTQLYSLQGAITLFRAPSEDKSSDWYQIMQFLVEAIGTVQNSLSGQVGNNFAFLSQDMPAYTWSNDKVVGHC